MLQGQISKFQQKNNSTLIKTIQNDVSYQNIVANKGL